MELQVSDSVITTLTPFLSLHIGIGLLIVAVFMYRRSDSVLKLFGVGIGLMGLASLPTVLVTWLDPPDLVQSLFTAIGAFSSIVGVVFFVVVGSSDYAPRWRRIALGGIIVWAVVLAVMGSLLDFGAGASENGASGVAITLTTVWFLLGWFIAFLEAAHIAVEHSHGEPYRSILIAAMSVFAVAIVAGIVASENDQLAFFSWVVTTVLVLVMWLAVVLHERKEIAAEHQHEAAQPG